LRLVLCVHFERVVENFIRKVVTLQHTLTWIVDVNLPFAKKRPALLFENGFIFKLFLILSLVKFLNFYVL
jgi:hypothetical protein